MNLQQSFSVKFEYKVFFTNDLFDLSNTALINFLKENKEPDSVQKILFIIDDGVLKTHSQFEDKIRTYFARNPSVSLVQKMLVIGGGESAKNHSELLTSIIEAIDSNGIDRHSYIAAIGGGSVLDLTGFAAAISHRGIRHIRIPTTVLSQNDSGVGVKNGINYDGKKNFLGTFVPPVAVFNDGSFLSTLDLRNWRSGIAEAVKVALIKDAHFFEWIEAHNQQLINRDQSIMNELIRRCAELHMQHIASGDPFELGSSRPLDFGHWSAHKLEQLSDFKILHGEAVAMGIALDSFYSALSGRISLQKAERIIQLLIDLGFEITHPLLKIRDDESGILKGLQEFREHLGGRLNIMLLRDIGMGEEVHELDLDLLKKASLQLSNFRHGVL